MQEGDDLPAGLRELAAKCRQLASLVTDEQAAASLRKLAEEYEMTADAADQRDGFHWKQVLR